MENYVWRPRATIVAIADMVILVTFGVLLIVLFAAYPGNGINYAVTINTAIISPHASHETENTEHKVTLTASYTTVVIIVVVCVLMIALQFWAAVKLLKAGEIDEEPKNALEMALFWRNVTIAMFIIFIAGYLVGLNILGLAFTIIWRSISFYVVIHFIGEINFYINHPQYAGNNPPVHAVYSK